MDAHSAFRPGGRTFLVMASNVPGIATMASTRPSGDVPYLINNLSTVGDAFVGYGPSSGAAVGNCVVPLIGSASATLLVNRGTAQVFTLTPQLWFSAITRQGNQAEVYISPGDGL
jgi:hypothetical protein